MFQEYDQNMEKASIPVEIYAELGYETVDIELYMGEADEPIIRFKKSYLEMIDKLIESHEFPFILGENNEIYTEVLSDAGINDLEIVKDTFLRLVRYIDYKIDEAKLKPRP
jgi:hypothetical protein